MPSKEARAKMSDEQLKEITRKNKIYRQTGAGKKLSRISSWKHRGVKCDDWDSLHEKYINSTVCECCHEPYPNGKINQKHLDHCHKTGKFRNILCRRCNHLRGHIDTNYIILMRLMSMN